MINSDVLGCLELMVLYDVVLLMSAHAFLDILKLSGANDFFDRRRTRVAELSDELPFLVFALLPIVASAVIFTVMMDSTVREKSDGVVVMVQSVDEIVVFAVMEKGGVEPSDVLKQGGAGNPSGSIGILHGVRFLRSVQICVFEEWIARIPAETAGVEHLVQFRAVTIELDGGVNAVFANAAESQEIGRAVGLHVGVLVQQKEEFCPFIDCGFYADVVGLTKTKIFVG